MKNKEAFEVLQIIFPRGYDFDARLVEAVQKHLKHSQQQLLERLSESHILKYERHKIFECNRGPLEKALYEDWCENPECHSVDAVITRERNRLKKEVKALIQEEKSKI